MGFLEDLLGLQGIADEDEEDDALILAPLGESAEQTETDQGFVDGILQNLEDIKNDPIRGLPFVLETGGAILGGLGSGGFGAPVGAFLGRTVGEFVESQVRDTEFLTGENAFEILAAPLFSIPFSLPTATAKAFLRGTKNGASRIAKTIIDPLLPPSNIGDLLKQTADDVFMQRQAAFLDDQLTFVTQATTAEKRLQTVVEQEALRKTAVKQTARTAVTGDGLAGAIAERNALNEADALDELLGGLGVKEKVGEGQALGALEALTVKREAAELTSKRFVEERDALAVAQDTIPDSINQQIEKAKGLIMLGEERNLPGAEIIQAGKQVGFLPKLFSPIRELVKFGNPEGELIANAGIIGSNLRRNTSDMLGGKFKPLLKEFNISEGRVPLEEQIALNMFLRSPNIRKGLLDGTITQVEGFAPERLRELAQFSERVITDVRDPALQLIRTSQLDPRDAAARLGGFQDSPVNRDFFSSASVGTREAEIVADDLDRSIKLLQTLSAEEAEGTFGQALRAQTSALNARKAVAQTAADSIDGKVMEAADFVEKTGKISKSVFLGAFQESDEKLLLGSNFVASMQDYVDGLSRKIALDNTLPVMLDAIKRMGSVEHHGRQLVEQATALAKQGDEAATQLLRSPDQIRQKAEQLVKDQRPLADFASKYALAQTGQTRMAATYRLADQLKLFPGLQDVITPQRVQDNISNINALVYTLDIGLNPRFAPLNLMQSGLTLLPAVGMDTFGRALFETSTQFPEIAARAKAAGSVVTDANIVEAVASGAPLLKNKFFKPIAKATGFLPEVTERWNRVFTHRAGELQAEALGLTDDAVQQHAANLTRQLQFGVTTADRPLITDSPIGSLAFRFRSFTSNYATFLNQLRKTDKAAFADALIMTASIGGTSGVPMYDFVREQAAEQGFLLPQVDTLDQMVGVDFGRSTDFALQLPTKPTEFLGPVFGPTLDLALGVANRDSFAQATAIQRLGGPLLGRVPETIGQFASGGVTRTPSGRQVLGIRSDSDIIKTAVGFRPSVRQERGEIRRELELALKAKDQKRVRELTRAARERGLTNIRGLLSQARGNNTRGENSSVLSVLFGV